MSFAEYRTTYACGTSPVSALPIKVITRRSRKSPSYVCSNNIVSENHDNDADDPIPLPSRRHALLGAATTLSTAALAGSVAAGPAQAGTLFDLAAALGLGQAAGNSDSDAAWLPSPSELSPRRPLDSKLAAAFTAAVSVAVARVQVADEREYQTQVYRLREREYEYYQRALANQQQQQRAQREHVGQHSSSGSTLGGGGGGGGGGVESSSLPAAAAQQLPAVPDLEDNGGMLNNRLYFSFLHYILWKVVAQLEPDPLRRQLCVQVAGEEIAQSVAQDCLTRASKAAAKGQGRATSVDLVSCLDCAAARLAEGGYIQAYCIEWAMELPMDASQEQQQEQQQQRRRQHNPFTGDTNTSSGDGGSGTTGDRGIDDDDGSFWKGYCRVASNHTASTAQQPPPPQQQRGQPAGMELRGKEGSGTGGGGGGLAYLERSLTGASQPLRLRVQLWRPVDIVGATALQAEERGFWGATAPAMLRSVAAAAGYGVTTGSETLQPEDAAPPSSLGQMAYYALGDPLYLAPALQQGSAQAAAPARIVLDWVLAGGPRQQGQKQGQKQRRFV